MYHCNTVDENDKLMNDCGTEDYTGVAKTTNLINNTTTSTEKIENFLICIYFLSFLQTIKEIIWKLISPNK